MKKRLVALTLVAAMALGMTACGSKSNNKTTTNDTSNTAVSTAVDWTSYDELVDSIRTEADLATTSICSRIMLQTYTQQ